MATRRDFLGGVGAVAALAATGIPAIAAPTVEAVPVVPLPAWEVGSGEWDFFAETQKEAQSIWYVDAHGHEPDEPCGVQVSRRN